MGELFIPINFDGVGFKRAMVAWREANLPDFDSQEDADSALSDWVKQNVGEYTKLGKLSLNNER